MDLVKKLFGAALCAQIDQHLISTNVTCRNNCSALPILDSPSSTKVEVSFSMS